MDPSGGGGPKGSARGHRTALLLVLAAGLVRCSDSPTAPAPPSHVGVVLEYERALPAGSPDPAVVTGCLHHFAPIAGSGPAFQGSWSQQVLHSVPAGTVFQTLAPDVPVGREQVVRVYDLDLCGFAGFSEPAAVRIVRANGVLLTRVARHGSGLEGAAFTVGPDGVVRP